MNWYALFKIDIFSLSWFYDNFHLCFHLNAIKCVWFWTAFEKWSVIKKPQHLDNGSSIFVHSDIADMLFQAGFWRDKSQCYTISMTLSFLLIIPNQLLLYKSDFLVLSGMQCDANVWQQNIDYRPLGSTGCPISGIQLSRFTHEREGFKKLGWRTAKCLWCEMPVMQIRTRQK